MVLALAGWINRQQLDVIEYLKEENRVLRELSLPKASSADGSTVIFVKPPGCSIPTEGNAALKWSMLYRDPAILAKDDENYSQ